MAQLVPSVGGMFRGQPNGTQPSRPTGHPGLSAIDLHRGVKEAQAQREETIRGGLWPCNGPKMPRFLRLWPPKTEESAVGTGLRGVLFVFPPAGAAKSRTGMGSWKNVVIS